MEANSSAIKSFHVSKEHGLVIEFVSGKKYAYPEATLDVLNGLKEAESKGQYFNKEIRPNFQGVLI